MADKVEMFPLKFEHIPRYLAIAPRRTPNPPFISYNTYEQRDVEQQRGPGVYFTEQFQRASRKGSRDIRFRALRTVQKENDVADVLWKIYKQK